MGLLPKKVSQWTEPRKARAEITRHRVEQMRWWVNPLAFAVMVALLMFVWLLARLDPTFRLQPLCSGKSAQATVEGSEREMAGLTGELQD